MESTGMTDSPLSSAVHYLRLLCKPSETHREAVHFFTQALLPFHQLHKQSNPLGSQSYLLRHSALLRAAGLHRNFLADNF